MIMKIKIIKEFILNGKRIKVGTVMDFSTSIPKGHYQELQEVKETFKPKLRNEDNIAG